MKNKQYEMVFTAELTFIVNADNIKPGINPERLTDEQLHVCAKDTKDALAGCDHVNITKYQCFIHDGDDVKQGE